MDKVHELVVIQNSASFHSDDKITCMYLLSEVNIGENPILTDSEAVIGRLLHLSTMQCPILAKSWYTLAGWCYKWGRKAVDSARSVLLLDLLVYSNVDPSLPKQAKTTWMLQIMSRIFLGS